MSVHPLRPPDSTRKSEAPALSAVSRRRSEPPVHLRTGEAAVVYLIMPVAQPSSRVAALVAWLDARGVRVIGRPEGEGAEPSRLREIIESCSGVIALADGAVAMDEVRVAAELAMPTAILTAPGGARDAALVTEAWRAASTGLAAECLVPLPGDPALDVSERALDRFLGHVSATAPRRPMYAFLAVRIHDDFDLVRRAVISAVEQVLGIPCVWFEDPRVPMDREGVRARTAALIEGASLFLADVTFSPNNADHDSPNTAHEIGMALGAGCTVLLSCQSPRRNIYFSAGDLETIFWTDEADLHRRLVERLGTQRGHLGRRVVNVEIDPRARVAPPRFTMVPARRYVAPRAHLAARAARAATAVVAGLVGAALIGSMRPGSAMALILGAVVGVGGTVVASRHGRGGEPSPLWVAALAVPLALVVLAGGAR